MKEKRRKGQEKEECKERKRTGKKQERVYTRRDRNEE